MSAPQQLLPQSWENEEGLIACFLRKPRDVGAACLQAKVTVEHFQNHVMGILYGQLVSMWSASDVIDYLSLSRRLKDSGAWDALPGENELEKRSFLLALDERFAPVSPDTHIAILEEKKRRRDMILLCERIRKAAYANDETADQLAEQMIQGGMGICREAEDVMSAKDFAKHLHNDLATAHEGHSFISTGFRGIDLTAGPFQRGNVVVVSGQTGGGKSALVSSIIVNRLADYHMLVFSLEMRPEQYGDRLVAAQNRINMHAMRQKFFTGMSMTEGECTAIERTVKLILGSRLKFSRIETLTQIIAATTRIATREQLDIVALDYAQLVEVSREKGESREREVARVSRSFKSMANKLGFLGIILSQLNDDGKLRESRALAHDADAVLNIERDEKQGVGVRALKARSAPPGTFIPLRWEPEFTRFSDLKETI